MNIPVFLTLLFALQFIYWLVGKRSSKQLEGKEDYFLAGKTVRFFPLMMTFLATQVGGGIILGSADEAYHFGWSVLFYPMGAALGLILLGLGVGRKLARFPVTTVAQILELVYSSPGLRRAGSVLSVTSLFMILVAQIVASAKFLVSLGCYHPLLFMAFWAVVILYTVQGGLKAVISTDIVQASFFSFIFLLCFAFVFFQNSFSIPLFNPSLPPVSKMTGWLFMPLLFMAIEQDMGQRCFAGSSPRVVSRASFWAGVFTLSICVVPVFFGCLAKALHIEIPSGGSVLMTTISQLTNPWMTALIGCAIMAAIISTATSLINAISSNLSSDFKFSFVQKISPLSLAKGMSTIISLASILFALFFDNIVDLLIQSYELSVSCLFVPIFVALFKKKGNLTSAWLSILFGALGFSLFRLYPPPFF